MVQSSGFNQRRACGGKKRAWRLDEKFCLTPLEKVQKINTAKKEGKVTRGILLTVLKI